MRAQPAQAHVLIGTLGTLKNFSARADLLPHFARVTMLVVDEVDQVLVDDRSNPMRLNQDAAQLRRCVLMLSILSVSLCLSVSMTLCFLSLLACAQCGIFVFFTEHVFAF
jgi:hypothetical protein